jgi:hypothetical protein
MRPGHDVHAEDAGNDGQGCGQQAGTEKESGDGAA